MMFFSTMFQLCRFFSFFFSSASDLDVFHFFSPKNVMSRASSTSRRIPIVLVFFSIFFPPASYAFRLLIQITNPRIRIASGIIKITRMLNAPACIGVLVSVERLFASIATLFTLSKFSVTEFTNKVRLSSVVS